LLSESVETYLVRDNVSESINPMGTPPVSFNNLANMSEGRLVIEPYISNLMLSKRYFTD